MRRLLILLLFALVAAKVGAILARGPAEIERDAFGYWHLSSLVMHGDLFMLGEPIAYRTPIYPWFLALVRSISDWPLLTIVSIQGVLAVASITIASLIAGRLTKEPSASVLTWVAALPAVSAFTFAATILSETLFIFLMMLNMLAVLDYAKYGTAGRAIWVAVTFAVALLTRPIILLLWIPHLIFLIYIHLRKRKRLGAGSIGRVRLHHRFGHLAIAAATVLLLASPWLARNYHVFDKPFLTEFVGRNVWIVTFQDGSGAGLSMADSQATEKLKWRLANVGESEEWQSTWKVSNALVASGLDDAQSDRLMKRVALDAIASDRSPFEFKAIRRIVNFWRCPATDLPEQGKVDGNYRGQPTWARDLPPVDWVIEHRGSQSVALNTLLVALLGAATLYLIVKYQTRPYGVWLGLIFSYFAVITGLLEIPDYRYRIVIEPLAALTIGSAVAIMWSSRSSKRKGTTGTMTAA